MQLRDIRLDSSLCELTPRGTPAFPIEMYDNDIAAFTLHYVPLHWHAEAELVYAPAGGVMLDSGGKTALLAPGGGAFINAGCLHAMRPTQAGACETINIVFHPELIAGAPYSIFAQKYVQPLLQSGVGALPLQPDIPWQASALAQMREAYRIYEKAAPGFEFGTRARLSEIWALLCAACAQTPCRGDRQSERMKQLLLYLQQNYAEPFTLDALAASAGISVRTCCRCFRKYSGMAPFQYLNEYRVKAAADLLRNTEDSVTQICFAVGFQDTSYFTRVFRERTGRTPTAFRRERSEIL
jgi:AraC-like DNA-binding protein